MNKLHAGPCLGLVLALLSCAPFPAWAWNASGHRLVACMAWQHMNSTSRTAAFNLLRKHPDYAHWVERTGNNDPEQAAFVEASTWADEIRKDARFYTPGVDEPTPRLPGFIDMQRHRDWHYVAWPIDGSHASRDATGTGRLDKRLISLSEALASARSREIDRINALPWLIHLTGDAHQPLHTVQRLGPGGKRDMLGSGLNIINPFNPRKKTTTLHAFWDDLPSHYPLRGKRLDSACRALMASQPRPAPAPSSDQWLEESWQIARRNGYPPSDEDSQEISPEFFENSRDIARRRVAEAGYRLADLLNAAFARNAGD